ncbi:hypothetical protein ACLOJK_007214 [Asimina triloba]
MEGLPQGYRPNVGVCLLNSQNQLAADTAVIIGEVWIACLTLRMTTLLLSESDIRYCENFVEWMVGGDQTVDVKNHHYLKIALNHFLIEKIHHTE